MKVENLTMLDITSPKIVEIQISHDSKTVWINVDGICRLRACRIQNLKLNDERKQSDGPQKSN